MIPPVAHFLWWGRELPWVHVVAIRTALEQGGVSRAVLHHADDLSAAPEWKDLAARPGFEARRIDARESFAKSGGDAGALGRLFDRLSAPAARANVLRAAILAGEGGLYLDLDTVTVAPLAPILDAGVVCGEERVALPAKVARSWPRRLGALGRIAVRDVLRRAPSGYRAFGRIEGWYPRAVNNAVLGAAPGHPFVLGMLDAMVRTPPERALVRFALGTHLLQDRVAAYGGEDLVVHPPPVFYPLAPEISEHWFRRVSSPRVDDVVRPETRVVHWYASVRTSRIVPTIDRDYVRRRAGDQLWSALVRPFTSAW